jgi:UDPglucose--hexose-1-phosphate uridylyltransferase
MTAGEIRVDPISGRTSIIVPGRSARPNEHAIVPPTAPADSGCPFCEGNEGRTPPEVAAFGPPGRVPNTAGWFVRTIPNRFPTVTLESAPMTPSRSANELEGVAAVGFHEVIIESPSHAPSLGFLPVEQVDRVVRMCRDRVRFLSTQAPVGSVTLFENTGPESGGSLWHPHAQLVTIPGPTPALEEEGAGAERYRRRKRVECAFEAVAEAEIRDGRRTVVDSDGFVAFAPFASAVPYEVRLQPHRHVRSFGEVTDDEARALAHHLRSLLQALLTVLPGASYNLLVRSPVASAPGLDRYHWHLDLLPRLVRPDGFDLGSLVAVNTVPPEVAAEALRTAVAAKR